MSARAEILGTPRLRRRGLVTRTGARKAAPWAIAAAIAAVALVFGILLEQVVLAQSAFKLTEIKRDIAEEQALQEELRLEAARLASPARIERLARTELGMVDPIDVGYIVVDIPTKARSRPAWGAPGEGFASGDASLGEGLVEGAGP